MKVGARELRAKVGQVLEEVRRGCDVTVTHRNVPVAVIKPVRPKRGQRPFVPIAFGMWAGRNHFKPVIGARVVEIWTTGRGLSVAGRNSNRDRQVV